MYKILLVEDDAAIREAIYDYFSDKSKGNINVDTACDGNEGLTYLFENEYDLVLLDIMLPEVDGFSICREIRKNNYVPIIFITAKSREADVLYGYETGCDDYMIKPFSIVELYAKANAIMKRYKGEIKGNVLACGDVLINTSGYTVTIQGKEVQLAPKEFALLKYLVERKDKVISREKLLINLWGYDFEGSDRVVDNHIKKLRKTLGDAGKQIKTITGKGYKITAN